MELDIAQILTLSVFLFIFSVFFYIQLYDNHHGLVVILTHDC